MARPHANPDLPRRTAIAVFEAVAAHGVDAASMRVIAERLGLSTGTLNYHFGNKAGLLAAALDYAYREPIDWHAGDARETLERVLARYVLAKRDVRIWWRFWCAVTAHAQKNRALAARLAKNQRRLVEFVARVIADGAVRGELRAWIDGAPLRPAREAARLVALAHGVALRQLVDPRPRVVAEARALLASAVAALA